MVAGTTGSLDKAGATKMRQTNTLTAGIDTSKAKLDIAVHEQGQCWQVANTPQGWRRLAADLLKAGVMRVGIEATGGYERGVVGHLRAAGFTVLILQPIQVRAFARVHRRRAKNDALDAKLIAACAPTSRSRRSSPIRDWRTLRGISPSSNRSKRTSRVSRPG
jgi:transposase